MSMKKCPKCGLPVGTYFAVCPKCGASIPTDEESAQEAFPSHTKKIVFKLGNIRFGVWDLLFLLLCNLSFALILINVLVGNESWCQYPVLGLFTVYFFAFACAAGTLKRFLTRYRNAILMLNFVAGIFELILRAIDQTALQWVFDYFIPCNLILGCIVMLLLLLHPTISVRNVLFSIALLFIQSTTQLILMLVGVTAAERVPTILVSIAFGVNLISLINLAFLYLIKFRNQVTETFRFWE